MREYESLVFQSSQIWEDRCIARLLWWHFPQPLLAFQMAIRNVDIFLLTMYERRVFYKRLEVVDTVFASRSWAG